MNHIPTETEYTPVFSFEVKELGEDGSFTGYAATFGNKDLGGDVIERQVRPNEGEGLGGLARIDGARQSGDGRVFDRRNRRLAHGVSPGAAPALSNRRLVKSPLPPFAACLETIETTAQFAGNRR